MMKFSLIFLIFACHPLCADEESAPSLVDYIKGPIPRVAGSVNVQTGNWVDQAVHQETTGPDPYTVAHSYCSASLEEGSLADGWDLFHPSDLEVYQRYGIQYNRKGPSSEVTSYPISPYDQKRERNSEENHIFLYYREPGGGTVEFTGDYDAKRIFFSPGNFGLTVVGSIDQPVRRDPRRASFHWDSSADHWIVRLGDGTQQIYSRVDKHKYRPRPNQKSYYTRSYHIKYELLSSGNRRYYHYDTNDDLKDVTTLSSDEKHTIHTVHFHRSEDTVKVTTSEGMTTRFQLCKLRGRENAYAVETIHRLGKHKLTYDYSDKSACHPRRVRKRWSGDSVLAAKYYRSGKVKVDGHSIRPANKWTKHFLEGRVREIWTKDFSGSPLSVSHSFHYSTDKHNDDTTIVRESDGAKTLYVYKVGDCPKKVSRLNPSGDLLHTELYQWDDFQRLLHRTVLDENQRPLLDRECCYDPRGNVTCEILRGSFSGRDYKPLSFNERGFLHKGEKLSWEAVYSKDGRSLKTAQCDPLGHWTYFEYEPTRHLMTARFTCDGTDIIQREYFTYDSAAVCIESIVDDGHKRNKKNMSGVSRRTIHRIKPRRSMPHFGAPKEDATFIWTPEGGEQCLCIERYVRDDLGRATAKELLDASETVQKRWTYKYDKVYSS
jgi:hypothetical protein